MIGIIYSMLVRHPWAYSGINMLFLSSRNTKNPNNARDKVRTHFFWGGGQIFSHPPPFWKFFTASLNNLSLQNVSFKTCCVFLWNTFINIQTWKTENLLRPLINCTLILFCRSNKKKIPKYLWMIIMYVLIYQITKIPMVHDSNCISM